jgi:Insertion element 4 transposase N-terminal
LRTQSAVTAITRAVTVAAGVFAPGHLGELTQYLPFELAGDILVQTKTVQRRLRDLPSRVGVCFVLALGMYPRLGYARVWGKLTAGLEGLPVACPSEKALRDLRRRLGPAPIKALFEVVAGPLAQPHTRGVRSGALLLARAKSTRHPPVLAHLPDGSCLSCLDGLQVRIIEASVTVTGADGSRVSDSYRLITTLMDHRRFPAAAVVRLYHEQREIESAYFALRHTLLQGHVLRSGDRPGLEQETWALLTRYQLLRMAMVDAIRPGRHRPGPGQLHYRDGSRQGPAHRRPRDLPGRPGRPAWRDRPGRAGYPAARPPPTVQRP